MDKGDILTILSIKQLERYTDNERVFPAFDLEVAPRETVAIYSSTNVRQVLLAMFMGELPLYGGEIRVNDQTYTGDRKSYLAEIGLLLLEEGFYDRLTVKESFSFYRNLNGSTKQIDEVIRAVKLEEKAKTKLAKLSPSEKKRVQYARLLFQDPALLVLEEPDQNVDNVTKHVFQRLVGVLAESGKALLL
jgi:ABC-2 type transport system ATP-binding protein